MAKRQKDKERSTKDTHRTKDRVTRTPQMKSIVYTFFSQLTNLPGSKLNDLGCLDCLFFAAYWHHIYTMSLPYEETSIIYKKSLKIPKG
jgi:hypothetical protein